MHVAFVDQRKLDEMIGKFDRSSLIAAPVLIYEQFCSQIRSFPEASTRIVVTQQKRSRNWLTVEIMNAIAFRDLQWKRFKQLQAMLSFALAIESQGMKSSPLSDAQITLLSTSV